MKFTAYILSVVIIVLLSEPCIDKPFHNAFHETELSADTPRQHQHHHGPGHCSPFCSCQCCQAIFTISNPVAFFAPEKEVLEFPELIVNFVSDELFDFFIPPKSITPVSFRKSA
ncbi:MAG TPA: DUF6660 family protein [Bacteroidales bacterium]|nr:DUF6660 family protein [Bacteroidales bacterium]